MGEDIIDDVVSIAKNLKAKPLSRVTRKIIAVRGAPSSNAA